MHYSEPVKRTSKYRGVSKHRDKWRARISVRGKTHNLGVFDNPKAAAMAYDDAAISMRSKANPGHINFTGVKADGRKLHLDEPVWVSSDGRKTPLSLLSVPHLLNIERRLRYKGAVIPESGTQLEWYRFINEEVERRDLQSLPDHDNSTAEVVELPVFLRTMNGRVSHNGVALIDIRDYPRASKYKWFDARPLINGEGFPAAVTDSGDTIWLHRLVTRTSTNGNPVKYVNGNVRDCTRKNLEVAEERKNYKTRSDDHRVLQE